MAAKTKARRLKDFEDFGAYNGFVELPSLGRYATVHALADQAKLLAKLRMKPADCIRVDVYWQWNDDVAFVEIMGPRPPHPPIYAMRLNDNGYIYYYARVLEEAMTSAVVARVLAHFARHGLARRQLTNQYVDVPMD